MTTEHDQVDKCLKLFFALETANPRKRRLLVDSVWRAWVRYFGVECSRVAFVSMASDVGYTVENNIFVETNNGHIS